MSATFQPSEKNVGHFPTLRKYCRPLSSPNFFGKLPALGVDNLRFPFGFQHCWVPDRPIHNCKASKSVDRPSFEARKLWKGRSGCGDWHPHAGTSPNFYASQFLFFCPKEKQKCERRNFERIRFFRLGQKIFRVIFFCCCRCHISAAIYFLLRQLLKRKVFFAEVWGMKGSVALIS